MLNYNKIRSALNGEKFGSTKLAALLSIPESTARHRLAKENFTPDEIEIIADHFKKNILYFYDREPQNELNCNELQEIATIAMDPENPYGFRCKLCAQKDQTIEIQARYIANLEKQLGLDSENVKRTGS